MGWEQLRGHTQQIEMFRRTLSRGRLGQAYLFVGPEGVGKQTFATTLAQALFCQTHPITDLDPCGVCPACKQMASGAHPDFSRVQLLPTKRELLIEQFIGPKENRGKEGLCHDLSLKPMSADRKIAVIDDADKMRVESANALLKTLEEPPHGSLIVLIATNLEQLLPTIRSRCQTIRFAPLSSEDVTALILENEITDSPELAAEIAALSDGSLATAAQLGDSELLEHRRTLFAALASERFHSVNTAAQVMECIEAAGSDAAAQRQRAAWMIRFCIEYYRLSLAEASEIDPEQAEVIGAAIERAVTAQLHLDRSMSVALCMEALFDDLGRVGRAARTTA
ncbi:DNA polymerase III subunit tau [Symmachiella macrocystis]|uniref:DNA polymerase III subunit tau n=1 Tax=Symmachiella macrocystis TaxID=2527985 RepID=A0A5C6BIM1_9PLAN|nr:DNA polymerase III subunit delta' [Symmachiella macrocystis]TWU11850.1 DNA polymerase III subunit tau [Symmachiella macrocystis]